MTYFGNDGSPVAENGDFNSLFFDGPLSAQMFCSDVPLSHVGPNRFLSSQDFYHLGTCGARLILTDSLMNGCSVRTGSRQPITPLDAAILADLGYPLISNAIFHGILSPQLAIGGGFEVLLLVSNTDSAKTWEGRASLNGGSWPVGEPWSLNGVDQTGSSGFDIIIAPSGTVQYRMSRDTDVVSGWLEIVGSAGSDFSDLATTYFFNFSTGSELLDSTGVGSAIPTTGFAFPVEKSANVNTGIAIRRGGAPLTLLLLGSDGALIDTVNLELDGARFIDQIFSGVPDNFTGFVRVESGVSFYPVVVRQEIIPAKQLRFQLTSVPGTQVR